MKDELIGILSKDLEIKNQTVWWWKIKIWNETVWNLKIHAMGLTVNWTQQKKENWNIANTIIKLKHREK